MRTIEDTIREYMQDPEFKKEWDALEPQYQIIKAILDARKAANMTQKELSEITGITQADISRLESGNSNPTINTIQRIATGLGINIQVNFGKVATL